MIDVHLQFHSVEDAAAFFVKHAAAQPTSDCRGLSAEEAAQPATAKRTRAKKADAPAEQTAAAPASMVETQQASTPAPTAESLFATTEAPAPAKQPEQKDLITAFRALNEKKGTDAIVGLLGKFGAKTVALIPKDKWAEAIAEAGKLAA